jgi:hypothetical protein
VSKKSSTRDNPADKAVLDETKAAVERGEDPFGDDEPLVPETIEGRAAKAKAEVDAANGVTAEAANETDARRGPGRADRRG